jgi:hypothetical protein
MANCGYEGCDENGELRDGPWGNGVLCPKCHPEEYKEPTECGNSCKDGFLVKNYEGQELPTDIPCSRCRPEEYKTWSLIKDIERKVSDLHWSIESTRQKFEAAKLGNRVRKFFKDTDWKLVALRKRINEKTFKFRVRSRRHFYRYYIHSAKWEAPMIALNSHARIVYACKPTWIGEKIFRYPEWKEGYYGHPGEWRRMVSMNDKPIPSVIKKELDLIYNKMRLGRLVGR